MRARVRECWRLACALCSPAPTACSRRQYRRIVIRDRRCASCGAYLVGAMQRQSLCVGPMRSRARVQVVHVRNIWKMLRKGIAEFSGWPLGDLPTWIVARPRRVFCCVSHLAAVLWARSRVPFGVRRALSELSSRQAIARPRRHVPAVGGRGLGDSAACRGHAHCDEGAAPLLLLVARCLFVRMCARACVCFGPVVVRRACSRIPCYPSCASIHSCSRARLPGALRDVRLEGALPLHVGRCKSRGSAQRVAHQAPRLCGARFCAPRVLRVACQARRKLVPTKRCRSVIYLIWLGLALLGLGWFGWPRLGGSCRK
jgi:hypothetical protein